MNRFFIFGLVAVMMNLFHHNTYAESNMSCHYEKAGELHLQNIGGFLISTIDINNFPLNMVIDTGSEGSLISPEWASKLQLPIDYNQSTMVLGPRGGNNLARNVYIQNLKLGNLYAGSLSITLGNLPRYPMLKPPVVGLIGGNILSHYDLEFNVKSGKLTFWNVQASSPLCNIPPFWENKIQIVPIQMIGYRPFVTVKVNGQPLTALIDSGARSRIIALNKVLQMGISDKTLELDAGGITSGVDMRDTRYYWHQFHSFQLGNEIEKKPILTVSPLHDQADMLIGSDWFSQYRVWISYNRHMIYFIKE